MGSGALDSTGLICSFHYYSNIPTNYGSKLEPSDLLESDDDAPIIRFINAVLTEAVKDNASDVHIEPFENRLGVRFRIVPGAGALIAGRVQVAQIRDVRIEDLLGRPVTELVKDDPMLGPVYQGKRILVTGAGGSIGSEICRQLGITDEGFERRRQQNPGATLVEELLEVYGLIIETLKIQNV